MNGGVQPAGAVTPAGEMWFPSTQGRRPHRARRRPTREIPASVADRAGDRRRPAGGLSPGAGAPSRRRQAGDPVHVDPSAARRRRSASGIGWKASITTGRPPGSAGSPTTRTCRRAATGSTWPRTRSTRRAARRSRSSSIELAAPLLSDGVVPGPLRRRRGRLRLGLLPAARAPHPPAVRRGARRAEPPGPRDARHADPGLRRRVRRCSRRPPTPRRSPRTSATELLDRARAEVRAAVDEARLAVWNLRHGPTDGNGEGFVPAVSRLAAPRRASRPGSRSGSRARAPRCAWVRRPSGA